jgi:hypothetical protein
MAEYNEFNWLKGIQNSPRFLEMGFVIFNKKEFEESNREKDWGFAGKRVIGTSQELPNYNQIFLFIEERNPDKLFFAFQAGQETDDDFIIVPMRPTLEDFEQLFHLYVYPGSTLPQSGGMLNRLAHAANLQTAELISPRAENVQRISFMVAFDDFDATMYELEDRLVMNPFLGACLSMATAEQSKNRFMTQYLTAFSKSSFSIERIPVLSSEEDNLAVFCIRIDYQPHPFEPLIAEWKTKNLQNHPLHDFPNDIPLDVLGALLKTNFNVFWTQNMLVDCLNGVNDVEDPSAASIFLASMCDNVDFERVFLPLAAHPDIEIRTDVAAEAFDRKEIGKNVLAAVLKNGISESFKSELLSVMNEKNT